MNRDRTHCLWINFDSYEFKDIILQNKGLMLDMPFEEFIEILKDHFKETVEEKTDDPI